MNDIAENNLIYVRLRQTAIDGLLVLGLVLLLAVELAR